MQAKHALIPYVPMLVPPKKWKGYDIDRTILMLKFLLGRLVIGYAYVAVKLTYLVKFSIPFKYETTIDL